MTRRGILETPAAVCLFSLGFASMCSAGTAIINALKHEHFDLALSAMLLSTACSMDIIVFCSRPCPRRTDLFATQTASSSSRRSTARCNRDVCCCTNTRRFLWDMQFLDLDRDLAEGFYPITERGRRHFPRPADLRAAWEERVDPFRACLPPMGEPRAIVLRDLMVVVALRCGYDARTR